MEYWNFRFMILDFRFRPYGVLPFILDFKLRNSVIRD